MEISRSIAYLTFLGLGLVVVSTMFQIAISLQILSLEINALSAKRRSAIFYTMVTLAMIITTAFEIWIHIYGGYSKDQVRINKVWDTLWYTLVTILYIFVIKFLIKQLNKINESEL